MDQVFHTQTMFNPKIVPYVILVCSTQQIGLSGESFQLVKSDIILLFYRK